MINKFLDPLLFQELRDLLAQHVGQVSKHSAHCQHDPEVVLVECSVKEAEQVLDHREQLLLAARFLRTCGDNRNGLHHVLLQVYQVGCELRVFKWVNLAEADLASLLQDRESVIQVLL